MCGILALIICKNKKFTDDIIENNNEHLGDKGYNGIDQLQVVVDELADDSWKLGHKNKSEPNI